LDFDVHTFAYTSDQIHILHRYLYMDACIYITTIREDDACQTVQTEIEASNWRYVKLTWWAGI
jgi:hypothetical protein